MDRNSESSHLVFTSKLVFGFVVLLFCCAAARGACKLFDDMVAARAASDAASDEWRKITFDPDLEAKFATAFTMVHLYDDAIDDHMSGIQLIKELVREGFTKEEAERVQKTVQARAAAQKKADTAAAAARKAEQAWRDFFAKKELAMDEADAQFRKDRELIKTERAALEKLEVNSPEYLDRASKLLEHLKDSYADMLIELHMYRGCFADVARVFDDITRRIDRIAELEKEIARRRGSAPPGVPGVTTLHPDRPPPVVMKPGFDPNADAAPTTGDPNIKLGDEWVWDGKSPKVEVMAQTQGKIVKAGADECSWEITDSEGRVGVAGVKIKGPPASLRAGQLVNIKLEAYGNLPAVAVGAWYENAFSGARAQPGHDTVCATVDGFKTGGARNVANYHKDFAGYDNPYEHYIQARMWRPLPNAVTDPCVWVTWTYVRKNPK